MTRAFERDAEDGMSEAEIQELVDMVAENPKAGDLMIGTGGCRKVRVAGKGKGKRGGYRAITFYTGEDLPVFLITVFGKGEKSDLTPKERRDLGKLTKVIVSEYRKGS